MALDPSIILGIKPVEAPDPVKLYSQIAQTKEQQQMMQARGLEIKSAQQQQAADQAVNDSLARATVIDPATGQVHTDRAAALDHLKQGGFGKAALGLQEGWQKQDATQLKSNLENQKTMLENQQAHVELLGRAANYILSAPVDQQPALYQRARQEFMQRGIVTDPNELPEQYSPQIVQAAQQQSMKASEVLSAQAKKIDQDQTSLRLKQEADQNATRDLLTGQSNAETVRAHNLTDARERQRLSIEAGRLHLEQAKSSIDQGSAVETQAQQIAKGELPLPSTSRQNPYNRAVTQRALEINPNLSTELYKTVQDFGTPTGKANQNIASLNKLAEHINDVKAASDKAGFTPLGITGSGKALRIAERVFSTEDVKFLSGSGGKSVTEVEGLLKDVHSPLASVRSAAINQLETMTASAARQLDKQYSTGTRSALDQDKYFSGNTRDLLQRHGGMAGNASAGKIVVIAPDGSKHPFDTPAQAAHFRALAGIK